MDDFAVIFGYQNPTNYYFVSFNETNNAFTSGIFKVAGGTQTQLANADITSLITAGTTYTVNIRKTASTYTVHRNNVLMATATDATWKTGKVGFGTLNDGASFDNLVVNATSFPRHPSHTGLSRLGINRNNLTLNPIRRFTAQHSGTIIENKRFDGPVYLTGANNMVFRRCWFPGLGADACIKGGTPQPVNVTFEDCDFGSHGASNKVYSSHIADSLQGTITIKRCFFYNSADAIKCNFLSTTIVEDSWLQPVFTTANHADLMQLNDNVRAMVFANRCTFEGRTWKFNGQTAFAQQELTQASVTLANVAHWGNGVLQTKPCGNTVCSGPISTNFFSIKNSIVTGGNYIMTAENQRGEFQNNIAVRGSGNPDSDGNPPRPTDGGLRDAAYIVMTGNKFHDNGAPYNTPNTGVGHGTNPTPIARLNLP